MEQEKKKDIVETQRFFDDFFRRKSQEIKKEVECNSFDSPWPIRHFRDEYSQELWNFNPRLD